MLPYTTILQRSRRRAGVEAALARGPPPRRKTSCAALSTATTPLRAADGPAQVVRDARREAWAKACLYFHVGSEAGWRNGRVADEDEREYRACSGRGFHLEGFGQAVRLSSRSIYWSCASMSEVV